MKQKNKIVILLMIFVLTLGSFVCRQTLIIQPGKAVGQFYLDSTTIKEIRSVFGKGDIQKIRWHGPDCGNSYSFYNLTYQDLGISFTFYKNEIHKNDKFSKINLFKKSNAETDKNISVGRSSKSDILSTYGEPTNKDFDKLLKYENLGISFSFIDSNQKLRDTLTAIYIYKPI